MEQKWMQQLSKETQIHAIMQMNPYSEQYGLTITEEDAALLAAERVNSLKEQRRVEFGEGIMPRLIREFCDSQYVDQNNYLDILIRLQDIFYLFKNEMMDEITDDELLHFMREQFDTVCFGDLDYLSGTCLENFATAVRAGYSEYRATEGYGAYRQMDEVPRWDYNLYLQALNDLE